MPFDSYANLQTAIVKWAMREGDEDFTASVPDFIALAEARISRELRVSQMEKTAPLSVVGGVADLPDDYLEFRSLMTAGATPYSLFSSASANWCDQFVVRGNTVDIGRIVADSLTLRYYARVPALSDDNPTNWLLVKAPDLYLYGSLIEAAPFMMDDARLGTWTTLYQKAIEDLTNQDAMATFARGSVRLSTPTP